MRTRQWQDMQADCYVRMENEWKKKRREEVLMGRFTLIKTNETLSESSLVNEKFCALGVAGKYLNSV